MDPDDMIGTVELNTCVISSSGSRNSPCLLIFHCFMVWFSQEYFSFSFKEECVVEEV
jgi:hypothetical protein